MKKNENSVIRKALFSLVAFLLTLVCFYATKHFLPTDGINAATNIACLNIVILTAGIFFVFHSMKKNIKQNIFFFVGLGILLFSLFIMIGNDFNLKIAIIKSFGLNEPIFLMFGGLFLMTTGYYFSEE